MIKAYAVNEAGGKLVPFEYDAGQLGQNEVEIDVKHCGICHSDLSMIDNEWGISQYPLVAGHEVIGTIKQMGENVKGFHLGQIVGLGWHSGYCGECAMCHSADENLCRNAQPTIISHYGGFAEQVRADAKSVVALPENIELKSAGPLFCGGVTVFNPLVQFDIKPTDKVAVIGIGGLGHIALQFLNAWGCEVTAFTSSPEKAKEALEMGAHHTINSRDVAEIQQAASKFDLIISTVNVKLDWNSYISTLKPKGRLHFVGATLEPLDIAATGLIGSQRSISGSLVGSPSTIAKMLDFAQQHNIKPIIEEYSFDNINEAIERVRSGKAKYRVVLSR
ncbi:NADP-dependent alcohol dehydrogenase C 2 [Phocoenobacter uteri]|uniref:alcohol dehydrogenase (NADP(+)) n=1 Tax=Phocoenobacter uteri TaxID=146806 RepID=A0A379CCE3_9PAST|nr:NAD(P)-dependent alcohol dehydrogenase [Phocoenobacter uteri]MDG6881724.1 alcohol dehydrogenase [Phocoenobacter uteri]SUB59759.1 NADP-dependent alcohol dehydrogenase C 2 [Phocoenobacter uteri]